MLARTSILSFTCLVCISAMAQTVEQQDDTDSAPLAPAPRLQLKLPSMSGLPSAKPMDLDIQIKRSKMNSDKYQNLSILSPKPNETVHINNTNLKIKVRLMPPIKRNLGHTVQILFDDKVITEGNLSFILDEANRGTHTVSARVIDNDENVVIGTDPVTVYVRKPYATRY